MEDLNADYNNTGLTLNRHPMAVLREQVALFRGCKRQSELAGLRHGRFVRIAGLVTEVVPHEALLSTDVGLSAQEVVAGYLRRWSAEVAYCEGKQLLGFHDPMVWGPRAVERAHPLVWFVADLVVLWFAQAGQGEPAAERHRPWYRDKVRPTFADMLARCRLHLWRGWLDAAGPPGAEKWDWLLEYIATAA